MTAKEYLQSITRLKRRAAEIKRRLREIESAATNTTVRYTGDGGSASPSASSAMERAVISMVELQTQYADALERLHRRQAEAERLIELLPDELLKDVLERRYFDGKSWARIARELHYSKQHIYRLHDRALRLFTPLFEDARK